MPWKVSAPWDPIRIQLTCFGRNHAAAVEVEEAQRDMEVQMRAMNNMARREASTFPNLAPFPRVEKVVGRGSHDHQSIISVGFNGCKHLRALRRGLCSLKSRHRQQYTGGVII